MSQYLDCKKCEMEFINTHSVLNDKIESKVLNENKTAFRGENSATNNE